MQKLYLTLILLIITNTINSQSIFGKWYSTNEETGEIDSVIEVYKKQEKAFAKIIEIKNSERRNAVCDLCKDKNKNKPILGLNILNGLERDGEEWSGGTILDPRNGNVYKCYIQLVQKDKLKIRGYLGLALFGKTAYWQRAK
jgi:uncharacterized protein (DUF2147 family)